MANWRYILIVLVICLAGYSGLFLFGRSPAYCTVTKSSADSSPCYKFAVRGERADILLVGDSSLLYGVEPRIVEAVAHRSVYNYGVVGPVFAFNPTAVIDHYLATNRRPRAIIVYVSPWDVIEPGHIHDPIWFPIGLAALQHPEVLHFADLLRARPSALVELPPIVAGSIVPRSIGRATSRGTALRAQMDRDHGFFDYGALLPADDARLTDCPTAPGALPPPDTRPSRAAFARLKARYGAQGLPVHFYIAPFARCGVVPAALGRVYAGLADNPPMPLDDALFARERGAAHVHVNVDGARVVSELLGRFILMHDVGTSR